DGGTAGVLDVDEVWTYTATFNVTQPVVDNGNNVVNTASIAFDEATVQEAEAITTISTAPSIVLEKTGAFNDENGDGFAQVDETISYGFVVTNTGNVTVSDITITDPLVTVSGGPITLVPGASDATTFTATYSVTQADIDEGQVVNQALASGTDPTGEPVEDLSDDPNALEDEGDDDPTVTVTPPLYSIAVAKTSDSAEISAPGTITYEITLTNTGSGTVTNPVIDDPLTDNEAFVSGDTDDDGELDVGEIWIYAATLDVDQAAIDAGGIIENTVTATTDETPEPVTDSTETEVLSNPEFSITKVADKDSVGPEADSVNYTITVVNTGNVTLTGTSLEDVTTQSNLEGTQTFPVPLASGPTLTAGDDNDDGNLDVGETWTYEASIAVTDEMLQITDDFRPGEITNIATFDATQVDAASDDAVTQVETQVESPEESIDLTITKTTPRENVLQGDVVPWTIEVTNNGAVEAQAANISDRLPAGFLYQEDSATINGAAAVVTVENNVVRFPVITIQPGDTAVLQLSSFITGGVQPGIHTNFADVVDSEGDVETASASVILRAEPVFDCGTVIGKVFDDVNQNGYQDEAVGDGVPVGLVANDNIYLGGKGGKGGKLAPPARVAPKGEPGIPGVRIYTVKGEVYTTDQFGRFHVACADLPRDIGSNFTMKIDTRSLPAGYRMTTENPRVVRLTAGKVTKMNFGATISRLVRIDVADNAFVPGSNEPKAAFVAALGRAVTQFHNKPATVRISYLLKGEEHRTARVRMRKIEAALRQIWRTQGKYKLMVEKTLQRPRG
ncbi:DUF11 domain-containing protein, partial [Sulfitobacter sp. TSTF-M16]|nr:DUF11 domain-containing protein [Sulfitobacter aestuariivivens]